MWVSIARSYDSKADAADGVEQLGAGEDPSGLARQRRQQLELGRRQLDRPLADRQTLPRQIERQVHHAQHLGRRPGPAFGPAQHRPHAGDQLLGAEGLDHVVVGAQLEPDQLVALLAAGGEHDDRAHPTRRGSGA